MAAAVQAAMVAGSLDSPDSLRSLGWGSLASADMARWLVVPVSTGAQEQQTIGRLPGASSRAGRTRRRRCWRAFPRWARLRKKLPAASGCMEPTGAAGSAACRQHQMLGRLTHRSHTGCSARRRHKQETRKEWGPRRSCYTAAALPGRVPRKHPSQRRMLAPEERDPHLPDAATQAAHLHLQGCPWRIAVGEPVAPAAIVAPAALAATVAPAGEAARIRRPRRLADCNYCSWGEESQVAEGAATQAARRWCRRYWGARRRAAWQ